MEKNMRKVERMLAERTPVKILEDQERIIATDSKILASEHRRYERMRLVFMGQMELPGVLEVCERPPALEVIYRRGQYE